MNDVTLKELFGEDLVFDESKMTFTWREEECAVDDAPDADLAAARAACARDGFDPSEVAYVEADWSFAARFEVCHDCEGKGRVLTTAIREYAYTREDFEDDPDFMEEYMKGGEGIYGVNCPTCHGKRVVPQPTAPVGNGKPARAFARFEQARAALARAEYEYRREVEMERRYGC